MSNPTSNLGSSKSGLAYVQQRFMAIDEEGFVVGLERDPEPQPNKLGEKYVTSGLLLAGGANSAILEPFELTEDLINEAEGLLTSPEKIQASNASSSERPRRAGWF